MQQHTLREIAAACITSESYLSQIQTGDRKIKPSIIANFCVSYNYSPTWILTGKGAKKAVILRTKEDKLNETIQSQQETIRDLLRAMIEYKAIWTDTTKQLSEEAKKRIQ